MRIIFIVIGVIFASQQFSYSVGQLHLDYERSSEIYQTIYESRSADVCNMCSFEPEIKQELCDTITDLMTPPDFMRPLTFEDPTLLSQLTPTMFRLDRYPCRRLFLRDSDLDKIARMPKLGVNMFYCKDRKVSSTSITTKERVEHCVLGFFLSGTPDPLSLFGFCKLTSTENEAGDAFLVGDINVKAYQEQDILLKSKKREEMMSPMGFGSGLSDTTVPPVIENMTRYQSTIRRRPYSSSAGSTYKKPRWMKKKNKRSTSVLEVEWSSDEETRCPKCLG